MGGTQAGSASAGPASSSPGAGAVLLLVRHGETEWSRTHKHTGRTDVPLTDLGEQQARALAPLLDHRNFALVLTSPRERARRTAELAGLDATVDDDLTEWDYGEYEGITTRQIREHDPEWTVWTGRTPGGERPDEVAQRADRVLARVRNCLDRGDVVVVGHGHLNRVLAARWLGLPATEGRLFALGTAALCVLGFEHAAPVIRRWNLPNPAGGSL